jgi:formate-dependent phosphoribosylglycinamide formyltransferase (GAR transformylase)
MESIDALAKAVNEFAGGLVLVSHDMRLISQVAKEIWICDNKTVTLYKGDILNFKMDMRAQMGIDSEQVSQLRGDASRAKKEAEDSLAAAANEAKKKDQLKAKESKLEVFAPANTFETANLTKALPSEPALSIEVENKSSPPLPDQTNTAPAKKSYVPPHLRKKP